jgi:hypothetical protein
MIGHFMILTERGLAHEWEEVPPIDNQKAK